ncbi:uncharacterized protein BXZ73DRAFT_77485 [Epithele typhae]|uniref:uncharacterized protein n=1 Tax=Epithele typhae TaxID=378194 RepID=UPI002007718F|nr:uncharacterized protein BXZ73DRAFT_77485 [Epithele typhae]KAH9932788.1 hypothetical protein BXZ73DRAFT_77485 [Epithele typhae]
MCQPFKCMCFLPGSFNQPTIYCTYQTKGIRAIVEHQQQAHGIANYRAIGVPELPDLSQYNHCCVEVEAHRRPFRDLGDAAQGKRSVAGILSKPSTEPQTKLRKLLPASFLLPVGVSRTSDPTNAGSVPSQRKHSVYQPASEPSTFAPASLKVGRNPPPPPPQVLVSSPVPPPPPPPSPDICPPLTRPLPPQATAVVQMPPPPPIYFLRNLFCKEHDDPEESGAVGQGSKPRLPSFAEGFSFASVYLDDRSEY